MSERFEEPKERAVVVSTAHQGIFVGYTTDKDDVEIITLKRARMIVYHSADTKGFLGIGSIGVGKGSRVTPAVPSISIRNITSIVEASAEAVEKWEAEPWG